MADTYVRVGSAIDVFGYDDADFDSAIETTEPIKAGVPVDPDDVIRLSDAGGLVGISAESKAGSAYLAALNARRDIDQLEANLILRVQVFS